MPFTLVTQMVQYSSVLVAGRNCLCTRALAGNKKMSKTCQLCLKVLTLVSIDFYCTGKAKKNFCEIMLENSERHGFPGRTLR